MSYLAWALFTEGATDKSYFEVLLPRVIDSILRNEGTRPVDIPEVPALTIGQSDRSIDAVAKEVCSGEEAFHLLFIHADTGGAGLEGGLANRTTAYVDRIFELCGFVRERAVIVTPRKETEAWVLADPDAVKAVLGYSGSPRDLGLPETARQAERIADPKAALERAIREVRGRRNTRSGAIALAAFAQRQSLVTLRGALSFQAFEANLRDGLRSLGLLPAVPAGS